MSSIEQRLAALEAEMSELKAENELLKMQTPLDAITEGLKAATPAEVASWLEACAEASVSAKPSKAKAKVEKTKEEKTKEEKTTNPTGPTEWNVFKKTVWREMAAAAGIVEEDEAKFKKACKEAGITYQASMKEASRRKAEMEGKEPVTKVKKAAKAAPKTPSPTATPKAPTPAPPPIKVPAPSAPAPSAPSPTAKPHVPARVPSEADIIEATPDYDDGDRKRMKAESEGYGWVTRLIDDIACWFDPSNGNVISYDGVNTLGTYDEETGVFTAE